MLTPESPLYKFPDFKILISDYSEREQFCSVAASRPTVAYCSTEFRSLDMARNETADWELVAAQVAEETDSPVRADG